MIPRSAKFPLRTHYPSFRARAQKKLLSHALVYHLPSSKATRLAVIVPKKVSKLATTRNHLKRLTLDTLFPLLQTHYLDCVIIYKNLPLKLTPALTKELVYEFQLLAQTL